MGFKGSGQVSRRRTAGRSTMLITALVLLEELALGSLAIASVPRATNGTAGAVSQSSTPPPPNPASPPTSADASFAELEQLVQQTREVIDPLSSPSDRFTLLLQLVDVVGRAAPGAPLGGGLLEEGARAQSPSPQDRRGALLVDLFAEASGLVEQQPPKTQADAWLAIAERYITLAWQPQALDALAQAASRVEALSAPLDQAARLQQTAAHLADLLQPSQAVAALVQAEALLVAQPPSAQQATLLASLALQYADLGQQSQSAMLMAQARDQAQRQAQAPSSPPVAAPLSPLSPRPWDGSVGLLGSLFSGESSQGVVALSADADRQWGRTALDLALQLTYNVDDDEDDPDQFSTRFAVDAEHYFTEDWLYFVDGSVASDDLENLQLRATVTNGVGVTLLRSGDRELGLRTGVGARYENFQEESADFNPPSLNLGLTYKDRLLDLVQVQQSLNFDAPLGDVSDYLFRAQTDLRIPISDRWSLNQGLRLTLSGERAPDNPGLLFNLQTGLRYQF